MYIILTTYLDNNVFLNLRDAKWVEKHSKFRKFRRILVGRVLQSAAHVTARKWLEGLGGDQALVLMKRQLLCTTLLISGNGGTHHSWS